MTDVESQLQRIQRLDQGRPRKNITILGAGTAGLTAAYELEKLGHTVRIFEASHRVGGRVWTHRFNDNTYGELGAMRIPSEHDYTLHYVKEMGLGLRKFISAHQNLECYYDIRDIQIRMKDAPAHLYYKFHLSSKQKDDEKASDMFGRTITDVFDSLTDEEKASLLTGDLATDRLRDLDRLSLGEFLRLHAGYDATELIGTITSLESFFDRATTMLLREAIADPGEKLYEIIGGMDLLPTKLGEKISGPIELNVQVTGIHKKDDDDGKINIAISKNDSSSSSVETCDFVLCTLPFTILRRINITPAFSSEKMQAIRNLGYSSSTKVLLHCSQRFWETKYNIVGGASQTDKLIRATYYPSDNAEEGDIIHPSQKYSTLYSGQRSNMFIPKSDEISKGPGVLLGSYTWGQDARVMGGLNDEERKNVVIRMISRFHPEIAEKGIVDDHASMFWDSYRWSGGSFSFLFPGQQTTLYKDAIQPEGNIHFAGEHCSLYNAWIQGALVSALRAVEEIVAK
jgi:monoamine oxidase